MPDYYMEFDIHLPLDRFDMDVSFKTQNRVLGIFGPSGSGKTTLLESIAGLRRNAKGRMVCQNKIWQDDEQGIRLTTEYRNIGYVPQDHLLFSHLSVEANLMYGKKRHGKNEKSFKRVFHEVIEVLELQPLLTRRVTSLSGGEKQRVSIARALCSNPLMLIFDEPLSSLDIGLRERILPFLVKIKNRFQLPILVVSHHPIELQALCDEIIAISDGKIVTRGSPCEVLTQPNIYKSASAEGFQNVIKGQIQSNQLHSTQVQLGTEEKDQTITLLRIEKSIKESVMIGFPSNDILIATHYLEGVSARNQLDAVIHKIDHIDHLQIITTQLIGPTPHSIVVELTQTALEELHLEKGSQIVLVIKSSSIQLLG